jgi:hypothetical protein
MTDHTCGCLDGKPCEFPKTRRCPFYGLRDREELPTNWTAYEACAPMVALVEAREEAARWKRASSAMARVLRLQGVALNPDTGETRTHDEWLAWALGEES